MEFQLIAIPAMLIVIAIVLRSICPPKRARKKVKRKLFKDDTAMQQAEERINQRMRRRR